MNRVRNAIALLAMVIGLLACQETPGGRNQFAPLPDTFMADMGREAFEEIKRQQPLETQAEINDAVACVAREVIRAASEQYPPDSLPDSWEVVVFRNPEPNAFALPGGKIGVNTGLLDVAQTPAQLATVIGHEIGHVLADHGNERLTQELGIDAALYLVGLFTEGEVEQHALMEALGVGAQLGIALPFSRAHEREADVLGLNIMAAAGFEPQESVALWRNMAKAANGQPPEFLSTHPAHETRIERLQEQMEIARQRYATRPAAGCSF